MAAVAQQKHSFRMSYDPEAKAAAEFNAKMQNGSPNKDYKVSKHRITAQ